MSEPSDTLLRVPTCDVDDLATDVHAYVGVEHISHAAPIRLLTTVRLSPINLQLVLLVIIASDSSEAQCHICGAMWRKRFRKHPLQLALTYQVHSVRRCYSALRTHASKYAGSLSLLFSLLTPLQGSSPMMGRALLYTAVLCVVVAG